MIVEVLEKVLAGIPVECSPGEKCGEHTPFPTPCCFGGVWCTSYFPEKVGR